MTVDWVVVLGCLFIGALIGASLNQPWWGSSTTERIEITADEHAHLVNSGARVHVHESLLNRRVLNGKERNGKLYYLRSLSRTHLCTRVTCANVSGCHSCMLLICGALTYV